MRFSQTAVNEPGKLRDHGFDNIRFILILCVVFSHLLEVCAPFYGHLRLYCYIYSFHMPVFIFLFGYFARYEPGRILFGWVIPYLLFQTVYILFSNYVLGVEKAFQYTTPHWILWYLLVCIFYQLLIPVYQTKSPRRAVAALVALFAISLLIGYEKKVEYHMALSRFFVFQPWFVMGFYARQFGLGRLFEKFRWPCLLLIPLAVVVSIYGIRQLGIIDTMLYETSPYKDLDYHPGIRAYHFLMALCWLGVFLLVFKPLLRKKLPVITTLGENTLPVFLLHGFFTRSAELYAPNHISTPFRVFMVALVLVIVLGNPLFGRAFRFLFSGKWCKTE